MKNFLTQWEAEEKNRKIGGNIPLIDRKHSGNMLFIDRERNGNMLLIDKERSGNMLLIDRELIDLQDDTKCASLPKLIELVKKLSNLTRTRKKKPHHLISHSLTCFVELIRRPYFCFVKGLIHLTDGVAMGRVKLKGGKVAVGFFG